MDLQKEGETSRDSTSFGWTTIICQLTFPDIYEAPVPRMPFPRCFLPGMVTGSWNESGFFALHPWRALNYVGQFSLPQKGRFEGSCSRGTPVIHSARGSGKEDDDDTN
jgi:hypothetical protein